QAIAENADAVLHEVVPANWESERASSETARLLDRHPGLTVVWSASDGMAQAAAETIRAAGKVPGKDVLVGGIDWAPFAFDEVRRGTFAASVGGHFLDGAWALVLLHDHHRRPSGTIRAKTQLARMPRDAVDIYERVFAGRRDVDFSRFSR